MWWLVAPVVKAAVAVGGVAAAATWLGGKALDATAAIGEALATAAAAEADKHGALAAELDAVAPRVEAAVAAFLPPLRARLVALADVNEILAKLKALQGGGAGGDEDAAAAAARRAAVDGAWEEAKLRGMWACVWGWGAQPTN